MLLGFIHLAHNFYYQLFEKQLFYLESRRIALGRANMPRKPLSIRTISMSLGKNNSKNISNWSKKQEVYTIKQLNKSLFSTAYHNQLYRYFVKFNLATGDFELVKISNLGNCIENFWLWYLRIEQEVLYRAKKSWRIETRPLNRFGTKQTASILPLRHEILLAKKKVLFEKHPWSIFLAVTELQVKYDIFQSHKEVCWFDGILHGLQSSWK